MRTTKDNILSRFIPPAASFAAGVAVWHFLVGALSVPRYLVPSPADVFAAASANAGELLRATSLTALAALCGFVSSLAAGTLTAFAFSQSRAVRSGLYPYAIFLQTVPIVAIAPLVIIWFGTGFQSVIVVSFIISLFPVVTNATEGLTRLDPNLADLFRLHGASRRQILLKLKLPNAVPALITGARISSGLSVIGAIVGEFFAGYGTDVYGLGYLIVLASGQLNTPYLFAAVFACTLLGVGIFASVTAFADLVLGRWQKCA